MERLRQIVLASVCVAGLFSIGCAPLQKAKETVQQASNKVVESTTVVTPPATQMLTVWQSELQALENPTQDGQKVYGLPGQVWLLTRDGQAAIAQGDVTVAVHDETPRPNGQPSPHKAEVYHVTADVLARLKTRDERLGDCYVFFLPWPQEWADVKKVRISVRYDVKDKPNMKLTANDSTITLERQSQAIVQHFTQHTNHRSAPDPNKVLAQMGTTPGLNTSFTPTPGLNAAAPVQTPSVYPANNTMPVQAPGQVPVQNPGPAPVQAPGQVPAFQPIIIGGNR